MYFQLNRVLCVLATAGCLGTEDPDYTPVPGVPEYLCGFVADSASSDDPWEGFGGGWDSLPHSASIDLTLTIEDDESGRIDSPQTLSLAATGPAELVLRGDVPGDVGCRVGAAVLVHYPATYTVRGTAGDRLTLLGSVELVVPLGAEQAWFVRMIVNADDDQTGGWIRQMVDENLGPGAPDGGVVVTLSGRADSELRPFGVQALHSADSWESVVAARGTWTYSP